MSLFQMWYLGMIIVVILQQITIIYLTCKLEKEKENEFKRRIL